MKALCLELLCLAKTVYNLPPWSTSDHSEEDISEFLHHHAVDQEVDGGVHGEHDVGEETQDDGPLGKPSQISHAAAKEE